MSRNSYCNTIGQSCFVSFATCMAHPLLKLKRCVLLVMYSWLNGFYRVINSKYSITLLFFGSNPRRTSKALPINSIDSKCRHQRPHESNFKKPGARRPLRTWLNNLYLARGCTHHTPYSIFGLKLLCIYLNML